jgi:hypothetical protein
MYPTMSSRKHDSYSKKLKKYSCTKFCIKFPIQTNSFTTILINSKLYRNKPYAPRYKYNQRVTLSLPTPTASRAKATPMHSVTPLCHYTSSVVSPTIHPSGKHLYSINTKSTQNYIHPSTTILDHYNEYLLIYLLVSMFSCSCCIVIGAFMPSLEGQFCKSTPDGGAKSQFREFSPFHRLQHDKLTGSL